MIRRRISSSETSAARSVPRTSPSRRTVIRSAIALAPRAAGARCRRPPCRAAVIGADLLEQPLALGRRQRLGRLVEHEHLRLERERLRDLEQLAVGRRSARSTRAAGSTCGADRRELLARVHAARCAIDGRRPRGIAKTMFSATVRSSRIDRCWYTTARPSCLGGGGRRIGHRRGRRSRPCPSRAASSRRPPPSASTSPRRSRPRARAPRPAATSKVTPLSATTPGIRLDDVREAENGAGSRHGLRLPVLGSSRRPRAVVRRVEVRRRPSGCSSAFCRRACPRRTAACTGSARCSGGPRPPRSPCAPRSGRASCGTRWSPARTGLRGLGRCRGTRGRSRRVSRWGRALRPGGLEGTDRSRRVRAVVRDDAVDLRVLGEQRRRHLLRGRRIPVRDGIVVVPVRSFMPGLAANTSSMASSCCAPTGLPAGPPR